MSRVVKGEISELIRIGDFVEGNELEAKTAKTSFPANAWETVSAFANTNGGIIVLGLREHSGEFDVEGVHNATEMVNLIHTHFRNSQKISYPAAGVDDIWTESIDGRDIVIVSVPRVSRNHRPVYINNNPQKAYIRRGDADSLCNPIELNRMFREASTRIFDRTVLDRYTFDDFDQQTIDTYRDMSKEFRPALPSHGGSDESFLRLAQAYLLDRESGKEGPTAGGILMFGTQQAILDLRPRHVIDYRRIPLGTTSETRWSDRVRHQGNLFQAYLEIFPKLIRSLPVPFKLIGAHRSDNPPGQDSLREAFVNLLAHTDYEEPSDALILHSDTGYLFQNPGDSVVDPRDFGRHAASFRRNAVIAQLFDNVGLADQAGSGFVRIFNEWQALGFGEPNPISDSIGFQFTLRLGLISFMSEDDQEFLSALGTGWTKDEAMAMILARQEGLVSNQTLRERTGLGTYEASSVLTSLRDRGVFSHRGKGVNSSYFFVNQSPQLSLPQSQSPEDSGLNSANVTPNSQRSGLNGANVTPGDQDSGLNNANDADALAASKLAGDSMNRHHPVVQRALSQKRVPQTVMLEAVLVLCMESPQSISELAAKLNRGNRQVRRYIKTLLNEEKLVTTLPHPNDPDQKYEISSDEDEDELR